LRALAARSDAGYVTTAVVGRREHRERIRALRPPALVPRGRSAAARRPAFTLWQQRVVA